MKLKFVFIAHDVKLHPGEFNLVDSLALKIELKYSDHLVFLTKSVQNQYRLGNTLSKTPTTELEHPPFSYLEAVPKEYMPPDDLIRFLFFGRVRLYKGVENLLIAWSKVSAKRKDLELSIVGDFDASTFWLRDLAAKDRSIFIDDRWIPDEEISLIIQSHDIAIFPYIEASQSGVLPICLSAGIPCIITPQQGLLEQAKFGGVLVSRDSEPDALSEAILKLVDDRNLLLRLSAEGVAGYDQVSWKKFTQDLLNIE
jgi:glycosyltransferase involved in cell wall biosynthesis